MPEVKELSLQIEEVATVAATLFLPDAAAREAPLPLLFLFPGGGMSRRYFDIQLEGDDSYSQARWFARRGFVVVAMDYPGAGDSSPKVNGTTPNRAQVEQGIASAVRQVADRLRDGRLCEDLGALAVDVVIGAGHSVGGHLVVGTQAAHRVFDGIASLGASMVGTRLQLREGQRHPFRASANYWDKVAIVAEVDWTRNDHWSDVPDAVIAADRKTDPLPPWRTPNLPRFAPELVQPFPSALQAANVQVPVLLVYGEQDVTLEPLEDMATFRSTSSLALTIVPGMGHSHNLANSREVLWTRLRLFAGEVAAMRQFQSRVAAKTG